jgi:Na+-transporting methylmalonyl-CoA/oxaloacetate decarboxylase gamma subunit
MRKNIFRIIAGVFILWSLSAVSIQAQSAMDLRINEFMVNNDSNYVDDYGEHSPWIEIYNSAYNMVNIGGCYLTNDLSNPTMYRIPKGQVITKIPTQGYLVFWADSNTTRGILHLNFNLKDSKFIALFDPSGKTLIDSVSINPKQQANVAFGRLEDGSATWDYLLKATPAANNLTVAKVSAADEFGEMDPLGVGMIIIAMSVVFSGLAFLYLFFKYLGRFFLRDKKKPKTGIEKVQENQEDEDEISGEVNAAIVAALYFYRTELHDTEATVLTINKVARAYSPWSSKIYGLRKNPK